MVPQGLTFVCQLDVKGTKDPPGQDEVSVQKNPDIVKSLYMRFPNRNVMNYKNKKQKKTVKG